MSTIEQIYSREESLIIFSETIEINQERLKIMLMIIIAMLNKSPAPYVHFGIVIAGGQDVGKTW